MTILLVIIYLFVGDINNIFMYHLIYAGKKFINEFFYAGVKNNNKSHMFIVENISFKKHLEFIRIF